MNPADLFGELVRLVGEVLGSSSLRLGVGPTLGVLGVLLVFLQLVARPVSRWTTRDAGGLAAVGRAMALAAESGSATVFWPGSAGLARSTNAIARLQTLAGISLLGHVGRAAARAGVPLRVPVNDPIVGAVAAAALDDAHERTATAERSGRSRVAFMGEGRGVAAGAAMAGRSHPSAAFAIGGLGEEAQLLVSGLAERASSTSVGTADAGQAATVLLTGRGAMIGPEPYAALADLRPGGADRSGVIAADRLLALVALGLAIGTALALAGIVDPRQFIAGTI